MGIVERLLRKIAHRPLHDAHLTTLLEQGFLTDDEYRAHVTQKWISAISSVGINQWKGQQCSDQTDG